MSRYQPVVVAGVLVALVGAFFGGMHVGTAQVSPLEQVAGVINKERDLVTQPLTAEEIDFLPYWRVWNTLERKFIPFGTTTADSVSGTNRLYSSIEGLVKSYDDPYTVFMRPQVSKDFKIQTKGALEGIGSLIGERDGRLAVVRPLEGSPAEQAGLVPGDVITAIDGEDTSGIDVNDAVNLIRGEGGTDVILTIQSDGQDVRDVPITRGRIEIPSTAHAVIEREVPVLAVQDKGDMPDVSTPPVVTDSGEPDEPVEEPETEVQDFYLLRLFSFSASSINAFERELKDFAETDSRALLIDLRGNPGGYLDAAVNMASWFLPKDTLVVKEYRGPEKQEVLHTTKGQSLFEGDVPEIAVLVDKGSASAAEILAGALQEHGVATVVGTNTFGKGSVQELIDISDNLSLKVTVSRWYTPNGISISEGGLTPDIAIDPETASSADPWVDAAIDAITG